MVSDMLGLAAESGRRWGCTSKRIGLWAGVLWGAVFAGEVSARGAALPAGQDKKPRSDATCEEKFDKILKQFEHEKETAVDPYLRVPTIASFGTAPCSKTVKFLRDLYGEEDNPGIFMAISKALADIASKDAIETLVKVGETIGVCAR